MYLFNYVIIIKCNYLDKIHIVD